MLLHSIAQARPAPPSPDFQAARNSLLTPPENPVSAIGLPIRSLNAMHAAGIRTLSDAAEWSLRDLKTLPQVGPTALETLQGALRQVELSLQPSTHRRRL